MTLHPFPPAVSHFVSMLWLSWPHGPTDTSQRPLPSAGPRAPPPPQHPWVTLAPAFSRSGIFLPRQPAFRLQWGQCWLLPRPRLTVSLAPQANVEHMTEKMKTEIQRGLVLR